MGSLCNQVSEFGFCTGKIIAPPRKRLVRLTGTATTPQMELETVIHRKFVHIGLQWYLHECLNCGVGTSQHHVVLRSLVLSLTYHEEAVKSTRT